MRVPYRRSRLDVTRNEFEMWKTFRPLLAGWLLTVRRVEPYLHRSGGQRRVGHFPVTESVEPVRRMFTAPLNRSPRKRGFFRPRLRAEYQFVILGNHEASGKRLHAPSERSYTRQRGSGSHPDNSVRIPCGANRNEMLKGILRLRR